MASLAKGISSVWPPQLGSSEATIIPRCLHCLRPTCLVSVPTSVKFSPCACLLRCPWFCSGGAGTLMPQLWESILVEPPHPISPRRSGAAPDFSQIPLLWWERWRLVVRGSLWQSWKCKSFSSLRNVLILVVLLSFLIFHLYVSFHLSSWPPQMLSIFLRLLPFFYFCSPVWNENFFFLSLNFQILPDVKIQVKCHEVVLDLQVLNSLFIWVNWALHPFFPWH